MIRRHRAFQPVVFLLVACLCQTVIADKEESPFQKPRLGSIGRAMDHCGRFFAMMTPKFGRETILVVSALLAGTAAAAGITYWAFLRKAQNEEEWEIMKDLRTHDFSFHRHSVGTIVRLLDSEHDESKERLISELKKKEFRREPKRGRELLTKLIQRVSRNPNHPFHLRAIAALRVHRDEDSFLQLLSAAGELAKEEEPPHALLPLYFLISTGSHATRDDHAAQMGRVARTMLMNGHDLRAFGQIRFNPFFDLTMKGAFFEGLYKEDGQFLKAVYAKDPELYRGLYNQLGNRTLGPNPDELEIH